MTAVRILQYAILVSGLWHPRAYADEPAIFNAADTLTRVQATIKAVDPDGGLASAGLYALTYGNTLPADWLLDTPHIWGMDSSAVPVASGKCERCNVDFSLERCDAFPCDSGLRCVEFAATVTSPGERPQRLCVGHSDDVVNQFYSAIAGANQFVDILTLEGPPTGRFLRALRNAVTFLARSGRSVTIRMALGQYPKLFNPQVDTYRLLQDLITDARSVRDSHLKIYVAAQNTKQNHSWNHAKVLAVDGKLIIEGGHNLHDEIYLQGRPIFDVSMKLNGPAAITAHRFSNKLWDFICRNNKHGFGGWYTYSNSWVANPTNPGSAKIERNCLSSIALPAEPVRTDETPVLAVASPGLNLVPKNTDPSEIAWLDLLSNAQDSILISQQDLGFRYKVPPYFWPDEILKAIGKFIIQKKKDVYIVLSEPKARSADGKVEFSWDAPLPWVVDNIFMAAQRVPGAPPRIELIKLLCEKLHVAPIRFGKDSRWPGQKEIGSHAKTYIIDKKVFYIGSHNMYPTKFGLEEGRLQEFGLLIESEVATKSFLTNYWDPLWLYSKKDAVIGHGGPSCILSGK